MKNVMIIAGSDPSAGAGVQQDLKVATLLGAYGLTVVTALTVQNTMGLQAMHPVAALVVADQLEAVLGDIRVDAVKIGMLANEDIVRVVAAKLREAEVPIVILDPVLAATDGSPLLAPVGVEVLKEELLPLATLVTPNLAEAASLTGLEVHDVAGMEAAAQALHQQGAQWVLVTGGHLPGEPVDVLFDGVNCYRLPGVRQSQTHTHGSGCALATALATMLAQGLALPEAVNQARELVAQAIIYGLSLGRGRGPVNPYAPFARELDRYRVLQQLAAAASWLQAGGIETLIPEVQSNLGYATLFAAGPSDVAAFPGRILKGPQGLIIPRAPEFGASRHIAAVILTALRTHPQLRAAMNIRFFEEVERLAPLLHFKVASFDRSHEPPDIKAKEGSTLAWGVASVLKPGEPAADLIYDRGEWGKEPMIRVLGPDPISVAEKVLALNQALQAAGMAG
ncbi:MAG: bifunctional hydroxymethylpyrimidine kinase/phosphomethylpyrimidine kinase [Deltaproteobacteria bacterium]|nr:bifunctional hydroxymethylpyrimidine kinase/phosphomethylpyrimidine kinase [Deltaproteobacteria bacterium]MBW1986381.1 bifunctional hydroxymethylpyrimidine kinase/phosphomethylpyrimidine kinase [Deltaproteobacteria bacterium]MBW2133776.1 bifunctional hydroxymethylpyrimidine kinase/phosphomethylpyrimidine kinase [Deltaproteobacteria bacterium]